MHRIRELYELYNLALFRYFLRMTGNREEAAELTQETFYQACLSLLRFQGRSSLKTWLFAIARHVYLKSLRNKGRTRFVSEDRADLEQNPAPGANPEEALLAAEEKQRVLEALSRLPENYRSIIILKEYEGLSIPEIAGVFGRTENWARVTFFRAKRQFAEEYREKEGNDQC